ncbi:MAG: hypothetical protein Q9220_006844 [cf. Caloplaca sp. 1 TL-2023]
MFDILEADIVVFQETKIQRKDLVDDMVLVPGWDCYWSLPKHKKGRISAPDLPQSVCAPIRAEEGITGLLCPPNSATPFSEGPEKQQIGGYPTQAQMQASLVDANTLDSEGRCVILEFPAFVLLGVYSPANRDESRDDFRLGFLGVLDARIRNLVAMGKRVFLTGDLNISREALDTANAEAAMRKNGLTVDDYTSTPSRRIFNQLLVGGKVVGERDDGRLRPVMWDICRGFHPQRKGMFTCWEQKVNARPGNYGARIDYVLCSLVMKDWFLGADIQEGLMGSDHCPVYAVMKDVVQIDGQDVHVLDAMNPSGMFVAGQRRRDYATKDMVPMSGKLIPEFDGRRNIRDMFARKPALQKSPSIVLSSDSVAQISEDPVVFDQLNASQTQINPSNTGEEKDLISKSLSSQPNRKRNLTETSAIRPMKRSKSGAATPTPPAAGRGQQSLKGFFKSTASAQVSPGAASPSRQPDRGRGDDSIRGLQPSVSTGITIPASLSQRNEQPSFAHSNVTTSPTKTAAGSDANPSAQSSPSSRTNMSQDGDMVHDPVQSKETWSKLFTKPVAPRCEGHEEPCKTMLTKKSGMNCGRSFWMCARPLGPSGEKEKNTQWRCHTFIWCSDWNPTSARVGASQHEG